MTAGPDQRRGGSAAVERARLAAIVESSFDAIIGKDLDGIITSWNAAAARMYGYTADEAVGRHISFIVPDSRRDELEGIFERLRRGERVPPFETVRQRKDGSELAVSLTVSPILEADGTIIGASDIQRDITESKRAEQQRELLIQELDHRVKNMLAVVQAMFRQSWQTRQSAEDFEAAFIGRIGALAAAHELLTRSHWEGTALADLAGQALRPYRQQGAGIAIQGRDAVVLRPRAATTLAMVLHELATNAAKYGALSVAQGRVEVTWAVEAAETDPVLELRWREAGGPPVVAPMRRGFGRQLIERVIEYELGGATELSFAPDGVQCRLRIPLPASPGSHVP